MYVWIVLKSTPLEASLETPLEASLISFEGNPLKNAFFYNLFKKIYMLNVFFRKIPRLITF